MADSGEDDKATQMLRDFANEIIEKTESIKEQSNDR
jgi:hypothetical protein